MNNWIGLEPYDYTDQDEGIDAFSLWVLGFVFVALTAWGLWVAWHSGGTA